jgi:hypothetical protein
MWRQALGVPWFNEGSTRLLNELNVELGAGLVTLGMVDERRGFRPRRSR